MHLAASSDPAEESRAVGLEIIASVVSGGGQPRICERPVALMIGSEAHGLSMDDVAAADRRVTLAMGGDAESLNAGVAASILMYLLTQAREH
jgi:tRNA G18 (ribose-2'-O)-methylase SpoU